MYSNLTNYTDKVDDAFLFILSIITFFLVSITAVIIFFIIKYRKREGDTRKAAQIHGNNTLEIIWTVIPLILVLVMFYYGWRGWKPLYSKAPDDAMEVKTTARMWSWSFEYENGKRIDTLYVPVNKPVKLNLVATDVIHSIYVPAFRMKQDMVPGREKSIWFTPNEPGRFDLFCTEYCGLRHSYMYSAIVVMPEDEFEKWYVDTTQVTAAGGGEVHPGLQVMKMNGCITCHTLDGTKLVGPSYKGIWGHEVEVKTDGEERTITVDEEYIRRSIYDPNFDVVKGYNPGLMVSYKDMVSEEEVDQIIDYLKTLQ